MNDEGNIRKGIWRQTCAKSNMQIVSSAERNIKADATCLKDASGWSGLKYLMKAIKSSLNCIALFMLAIFSLLVYSVALDHWNSLLITSWLYWETYTGFTVLSNSLKIQSLNEQAQIDYSWAITGPSVLWKDVLFATSLQVLHHLDAMSFRFQ